MAASRRRQLAMPDAAAVSLQIGRDDRFQCGGLDPQIVKPGVFAAPHVVLAKKFDLVAGNRRHRSQIQRLGTVKASSAIAACAAAIGNGTGTSKRLRPISASVISISSLNE